MKYGICIAKFIQALMGKERGTKKSTQLSQHVVLNNLFYSKATNYANLSSKEYNSFALNVRGQWQYRVMGTDRGQRSNL